MDFQELLDFGWTIFLDTLGPEHRYNLLQEINFDVDEFYDSLDPELQELADKYGLDAAREFIGDGSADSGSVSPEDQMAAFAAATM